MDHIQLILSIASYTLPCAGFIVFFVNSNREIHDLEKKLEGHGGKDVVNGCIYLTGTLSQEINRAKNERRKLWVETCLVAAGAACGVIALLLP